ncbi:uncharacterized protein G2W53_015366 [Senna tora]|uniref:Uncharacterized protein n=1 Tax=Senna tora TaxID=362788 RepID=A0A834WUV5_9FABA|nr:uncharacterized protein G2W53_015366 [Senna tora]
MPPGKKVPNRRFLSDESSLHGIRGRGRSTGHRGDRGRRGGNDQELVNENLENERTDATPDPSPSYMALIVFVVPWVVLQ